MSASHYLSDWPDIVIFDYSKKIISFFTDASCPADGHVLSKVNENLHKCHDLVHDFRCMHQMPFKIISFATGHSGVI